jgi:replicative DNA helicase
MLGACLAAPWAFGKVAELLHPEDFSGRENREFYVALLAMHARGVPPDATLLIVELKDSKKLSVVRGPSVETIRGLFEIGVVSAHLEFYVAALLERSKPGQKAIELVESSNVIAREPV